MGFLDTLKTLQQQAIEKAEQLAHHANDMYDRYQQEQARLKAQEEQNNRIAREEGARRCEKILGRINAGFTGSPLFTDLPSVLSLTKDFTDTLLSALPSEQVGSVISHPRIDNALLQEVRKSLPDIDSDSTPILLIRPDAREYRCAITSTALTYTQQDTGDAPLSYSVTIPTSTISALEASVTGDTLTLLCNSIPTVVLPTPKGHSHLTLLPRYFDWLTHHRQSITDDMVDAAIRHTARTDYLASIESLLDDSERLMAYSFWEKTAVLCSRTQLFIITPELKPFGLQDGPLLVWQCFLRDITSVNTDKRTSGSNNTLVQALTLSVTFPVVELEISTMGRKTTCTVYREQAKRITELYRLAKKEDRQPDRVTQVPHTPPPTPQGDVLSQLERLATLKANGFLTEEEFTSKKKDLLGRL